MLIPVILAGGYGERLWPLSTRALPKPFAIRDTHGNSLFQATLLRVADRKQFAPPLVVCNALHRYVAYDQALQVGCDDVTFILEPEARNTAAAIALAALYCSEHVSSSIMLIMPADHTIEAPEALYSACRSAQLAAQEGYIVTFSITPTAPETCYGYIQHGEALAKNDGVFGIDRFIEKPEHEVAKRLLQSPRVGWNSGMFVTSVARVLNEYAVHAPELMAACRAAYEACLRDGSLVLPDAVCFAQIRSTPFDRAIMERTAYGAVIPLAMGWHDLGNWSGLHKVSSKDSHGNTITGEVVLLDVVDSYIYSDGTPISAAGLNEMLVVSANGQLLVAPMHRASDLHAIRQEEIAIQRPWGEFHTIKIGPDYKVKQLTVNPRGKISLQRHTKRSEHWVVVSGIAMVTRGQEQFMLYENQSTFIPAGEVHRLENASDRPLIIIEVQTGAYLGEDDIERFEDIYARVESA